MKRKALLLIIPFAAAALTGCKQNVKPCSDANITFQSTINIDVDEKTKIPYTIEGGTCSGELNFTFSKQGIVEITFENGAYYVKGLAEGEVDVTCNGKSTFTVVVGGETPEPGKEVVEVLSVKSAPATIGVDEELDPSLVVLNVKLSDGTQSTAKATRIELDTREVGETQGTAWYRTVGSADFNIKVIDAPVVEELTPAQVIALCDEAGSGVVVDHEVIVVGVAENSEFDSQYKEWDGKFQDSSLTFDGAKTDETYDSLDGKTVKIKGYPELYNGKYKVGYLPANVSPTGQKYSPTLLDVIDPAPQKEVTGITAATYSKTLYVGGTIAASDVTLTVSYSDGTSGSVKAQSVDGYSTASAGNTTATAHYGTFTKDFVVEVKDAPVAEELTPAQVIALCDEAGSGVVVDHEVIVVGVANDSAFNSQYKQWSGKFEGSNLTFDSAGTNETYDTLNGKTIKVKGYPELYNGTYKIGYLPANISPTGAKYNPTLLSVSEPVQKEVTGITAVSYTKTLYVGGTINPADVTLTVSYSDGTSGSVKAQSVDGYSTASAGNTTATAHYGTFTKDFVVEVKAKPAPSGNSYNLIKSNDDVTEGQYLIVYGSKSFSGVDTTANYATVDVSDESIEASDELVYVEFEEMSGGYAIKVVGGDNDEKYIYGQSGQNKLLFDTNKKLNTISVDNDGKATIVSETSILKFNTNTGTSDDRFRYYKSTNTDEKMALPSLYKLGTPSPQKTISGIELQGTLAKSSYIEGQTFDPSGLSLKVTYDDQSEETVTSGFTFNVTNPLAVGEYDLKATYQGHTTEGSVHISVVALAITALEIKSGMTKTAYVLEEAWAPAGIVVEATYNDGSKANLQSDDYTLEFNPIEPALDTEEVSIVAKVANGTTSAAYTQKVSVTEEKVEATLTDIAASGYTNTATVGQTYTFDGTVIASYSDGSSHEVTGYTWTTAISTASAGEKTGVISYTEGDVTKTCNVTVTVAAHENTVKTAYEAAIPMDGSDDAHKETGEMTFEGVVSAIQGNSFVVADGDYGILVYNYAVSGIDVGKTITVKATLKNYKGLIETSSTKSATLGAAGTVPTPVNVTSVTQLNGLKTNVLINCAQLEVVSKETGWASNNTSNWTVKLAGSDVVLSLNKFVFDSAKSSFLKGLNVGDVFSASNLTVGCFNNVNQLSVMRDTTFQAAPAKEIASLGDVTAPESIAKGGTLSVSDVSVAVTYDDTTTGSVHPDRIELDTSTVAESVTGTVYVGDLSATFTIKVEEAAQTKDYEFAYESKTNPTGLTSSVAAGGFETGGRLAQWTSCGGFTISTSSSYSNVTKVIVNTSTNGADNVYKISCTVGGNEFGSTVSMLKKSANEDIVFEDDAADGVVVITYTFTSGTKKSIYVGKVTITAK